MHSTACKSPSSEALNVAEQVMRMPDPYSDDRPAVARQVEPTCMSPRIFDNET